MRRRRGAPRLVMLAYRHPHPPRPGCVWQLPPHRLGLGRRAARRRRDTSLALASAGWHATHAPAVWRSPSAIIRAAALPLGPCSGCHRSTLARARSDLPSWTAQARQGVVLVMRSFATAAEPAFRLLGGGHLDGDTTVTPSGALPRRCNTRPPLPRVIPADAAGGGARLRRFWAGRPSAGFSLMARHHSSKDGWRPQRARRGRSARISIRYHVVRQMAPTPMKSTRSTRR